MTEPYNRKFVGINNYLKVLGSQDFHSALKNSLIILVLTLVIAFSFSIVVGLILNKKSKISPILTAVAIIPWALPPLVNGIIWKFVFYPGYGFMNKLLINMG
ncbi:carbohydrate ABC transporter permease, partial [Peptostreptococcus anaerobius]